MIFSLSWILFLLSPVVSQISYFQLGDLNSSLSSVVLVLNETVFISGPIDWKGSNVTIESTGPAHFEFSGYFAPILHSDPPALKGLHFEAFPTKLLLGAVH